MLKKKNINLEKIKLSIIKSIIKIICIYFIL